MIRIRVTVLFRSAGAGGPAVKLDYQFGVPDQLCEVGYCPFCYLSSVPTCSCGLTTHQQCPVEFRSQMPRFKLLIGCGEPPALSRSVRRGVAVFDFGPKGSKVLFLVGSVV